jgi:hypothetical protein
LTGSVIRMPTSESVPAATSSFAHKLAIQVGRLAYAAAHIDHTTHRLEECVVAGSHYDRSPVGNIRTSGLQRCCLSCLCGARKKSSDGQSTKRFMHDGSPEQWSVALLIFTFINPERRLNSDLRAGIAEALAAVPGADQPQAGPAGRMHPDRLHAASDRDRANPTVCLGRARISTKEPETKCADWALPSYTPWRITMAYQRYSRPRQRRSSLQPHQALSPKVQAGPEHRRASPPRLPRARPQAPQPNPGR